MGAAFSTTDLVKTHFGNFNRFISNYLLKYKVTIGAIIVLTTFGKVLMAVYRRWINNIHLQKFDGPRGHWLTGVAHLLTFDEAYLARVAQWAQQYGDIIKFRVVQLNFLMLTSPEMMAAIMKTTEPKDPVGYAFAEDWIGKGLLISQGPQWFRMRRLLTPAFHFDILKPYISVMNESSLIMTNNWKKLLKSEDSLDVFEHVSLFTLDSLLKCIFSRDTDCQHIGKKHPYIQAVYDISALMVKRFSVPAHHYNFIYYNFTSRGQQFKQALKISRDFVTSVINARKVELQNNSDALTDRKYLDFLDILLRARDEDGHGLTDQEIRNEVDTFMFEGHDTTASGISWCLFNLARFPEYQEHCRQEVQSVLDDRQEVTWSDLGKLEYLTMFLKESMRLFPPVPNVGRQVTKDFTFPDGRVAPAGTIIFLDIYLTQRNPKFWPDPLKFDPDRFSSENSTDRHSHAFVAFSAGPRNCIGQHFAMNEMKICLAHVLRCFKLEVDTSKPVERAEEAILRAKGGLWIKPTLLDA